MQILNLSLTFSEVTGTALCTLQVSIPKNDHTKAYKHKKGIEARGDTLIIS